MKLDKLRWTMLDSLLYGDEEPFEEVDRAVKEENAQSAPADTLRLLVDLFDRGFVTIRQAPITALGQSFASKQISPTKPIDVVGDLKGSYSKYVKKRDYLWKLRLPRTEPPGGVPFGIWVRLTDFGRQEHDRDCYKQYQE